MAFIDAILDDAVAYGFEGGPEYFTGSVDLENSIQIRDSKWKYPRHKYSGQFSKMDDDARDELIKVFHAVRGKRHSFKFKDWNDYVATSESLLVPLGTSDAVQLYKTYQFGPAFTIRPIQAVDASAQVFDQNGAVVVGTLDTELGMFTPSVAWNNGPYTWSGPFYVWVHFDNDYNAMTINSWRANSASVDLEEDKRKITATNVPESWEE